MRRQENLSIEFFPPRNEEAKVRLYTAAKKLSKIRPDFFSVTYGAGGGTRETTLESVCALKKIMQTEGMPHLACIGHNENQIRNILEQYLQNEMDKIVVLRGDLPSGTSGLGPFRYANELIEYIKSNYTDKFKIQVACYPECHPATLSPQENIRYFKQKVDAGADAAITQFFFNPDAYFYFMDACTKTGINIPIIPGIMPITNCSGLVRFSQACGAEIPRWILLKLKDFGDDRTSIRQFGIEVISKLSEKLIEGGAPGLHFYAMNQAEAILSIWENLQISNKKKSQISR